MRWRFPVFAAVGSWLLLACTAPGIPIVWDEGDYLYRADRIVAWMRLLSDWGSPHGGLHAFSNAVIQEHWLFINWAEGHPAWFALPIALSKALFTGLLSPLTAARLGPITVFSIGCGAVSLRLYKASGPIAAVVAPIALVTFPRIFSEAHFATQDAQLTAWWMLLWVADSSLRSDARQTVGVGILLGLTSATKFTGWLAWLPVIASRILRKDPAQRRQLLLILPISVIAFCLVNPSLWHNPFDGLTSHFQRSLSRAETFNISTAFLGRIYDVHNSLPWYNTVAWLVMATPLPILVLGVVGLLDSLRTRTAMSLALVFHWATLMIVRALPGAPPHDGIRLFLPAFGFWCVLAGIGAQQVWDMASRLQHAAWRAKLIRTTMVASLVASGINLARYYPQTLSHYSLLVGGVRGAARLGMEPTYWWDALDNDVLTWINERTDRAAPVAFSQISNIPLLHEWRRLRVPATEPKVAVFKWYVLQNRPGILTDVDRALLRDAQPAYVKYAGRHRARNGVPADLDVPLIVIFSYEQYQQAVASGGR